MSVLFAYPGQGAQRPGMLAALPDEPPVRACLEQAADCLGQAPAELESAEALRGTRAVQLCLLIAGVAASRLLETRGHRPGLVAGLSIGAYPAAVVAGALDFDDALRLVALRGELMQAAWPEGYGMSAILGLDQAQLDALILMVRREHPPLYLANVNAERQLVVAGSEAALAALAERARAAGASAAKRLAVSVPSHCALLDEPAARLAEAFAGIRAVPACISSCRRDGSSAGWRGLCSAAPRRPSKAPGRIPWTRCCARRKREPDKRSFEA